MRIRQVLRRHFRGVYWKCTACCCIWVVVVLAVLSTAFLQMLYTNTLCSDELSKQYLLRLCRTYEQGSVNGSLCPELCSSRHMTYIKCMNFGAGKIIIVMNWNGIPIVWKTKEIHIPYSKTLPFFLGFSEEEVLKIGNNYKYPEWKVFQENVMEELKSSIGFTADDKRRKNILTELWTINPEEYKPQNQNPELAKTVAMDSIWSLVQQPEFTFMKLNQNWKFIPKIYGTCGQFYAVEFMDTKGLTASYQYALRGGQLLWPQRRNIAVQMLELVEEMTSRKPQSLHMCDVKLDNFGMSSDGQLKAIDVDMFFGDEQLKREIMSVKTCSSQDDCDFFDCKGYCVMETKTCVQKRVNNNLQSVCEKLFLSALHNGYKGLLKNPPPAIEDELMKTLRACASPTNSPSSQVPGKADHRLIGTLLRLLKGNFI